MSHYMIACLYTLRCQENTVTARSECASADVYVLSLSDRPGLLQFVVWIVQLL